MSMPSFPPCGADMTKDEALTMIIASIAMEELALSHIVNAEGEKLQYILGTLPGGPRTCAGTPEVLAVNKSVKELLDTVMQSQMLLKGKLEKALEAGGRAPSPEPPCPCGPEPSCESCCPAGPSCPCCQKSAIQLASRCNGFSWDDSFLLSWKCLGQRGCGIRWDEKTPTLVGLDPTKAYAVHYTINVRNPCSMSGTGSVCLRLKPQDAFQAVLPLYFSIKHVGCEPLTLHDTAVLFPRECPPPCADLSLILNYKESLFVDQALLSIYEI